MNFTCSLFAGGYRHPRRHHHGQAVHRAREEGLLGHQAGQLGKPHTVPYKVTGKCGSSWVRLIPAPRGTGIVSAPVPKKLLQMAGIEDCYTSAKGSTGTLGNFGELVILCRCNRFNR